MADATMRITRGQLSQLAAGNLRAIKVLESLAAAVGETLPASIEENQALALFSLSGGDGSKGTSSQAAILAAEVQTLVSACRRQQTDIAHMSAEMELLRAELHDTRARLSSAIARAQADASQALILTTGV